MLGSLRLLAVAGFVVLAACGRGADPGLSELSKRLVEATPADQRAALESDLSALAKLDADDRLGDAERRALLDLFQSAARDGELDDDERALLAALTRDVVVGSGRLDSHAPSTTESP